MDEFIAILSEYGPFIVFGVIGWALIDLVRSITDQQKRAKSKRYKGRCMVCEGKGYLDPTRDWFDVNQVERELDRCHACGGSGYDAATAKKSRKPAEKQRPIFKGLVTGAVLVGGYLLWQSMTASP